MVETVCEFARIITPHEPSWSEGNPLYSCAFRLTDAQIAKLRSLGYKGVAKQSKRSGKLVYNFNRKTISNKGNVMPPLEVVRWDKQEFTELVGDGSKVIVVLEYGDYAAGTDNRGNHYPAGVSFRLGAIQILEHIKYEENSVEENKKILDKFKVHKAPEGYVEKPVDKLTKQEVDCTKSGRSDGELKLIQRTKADEAAKAAEQAYYDEEDTIPMSTYEEESTHTQEVEII